MSKIIMIKEKSAKLQEIELSNEYTYGREDGYDLVSKEGWKVCEGTHFTIRHNGKIVAHAAIAPGDHLFAKRQRLHQVIVDEAYRSKGLGKAVVIKAIQYYESTYETPLYLVSETERKRALEMYMSLGFKPYLDAWKECTKEESVERWEKFYKM